MLCCDGTKWAVQCAGISVGLVTETLHMFTINNCFRVWCVGVFSFFLFFSTPLGWATKKSSGKRLKIKDREKRKAHRQRSGRGWNGFHDLTEAQMMSPIATAATASTIIRMHIFFLELRWEGGKQHKLVLSLITWSLFLIESRVQIIYKTYNNIGITLIYWQSDSQLTHESQMIEMTLESVPSVTGSKTEMDSAQVTSK